MVPVAAVSALTITFVILPINEIVLYNRENCCQRISKGLTLAAHDRLLEKEHLNGQVLNGFQPADVDNDDDNELLKIYGDQCSL